MVAKFTTDASPQNVALSSQMGQVYDARKRAGERPLDYGRRGGMALLDEGDLQESFYRAAARAQAQKLDEDLRLRNLKKDQDAFTRALTMRQRAENVRAGVSGVAKLGADFARQLGETSRRELSESELGEHFDRLKAGEYIERVPGGDWKFTPKGVFGIEHDWMFPDPLGIGGPTPRRDY